MGACTGGGNPHSAHRIHALVSGRFGQRYRSHHLRHTRHCDLTGPAARPGQPIPKATAAASGAEMRRSLLEVRNVSRHFAGVAANDDVSIDCDRGEIVGLIGPNGAGKSTLFNLIAGALTPSSGAISFEGEDV